MHADVRRPGIHSHKSVYPPVSEVDVGPSLLDSTWEEYRETMDTAAETFVLKTTPDNATEDLLAKSPNSVDEEVNLPHRTACSRCRRIGKCARKNLLVLLTLLGAAVGIGAGLALRNSGLNSNQISYVHFPGELFLRMMKMFIIPITISSLVTSSARIDTRTSGRVGLRIGVFFVLTLVIVALTATILSLLIRPGENQDINDEEQLSQATVAANPVLALMDLLRNMFAENLVEACLAKTSTVIKVSNKDPIDHFQNLSSVINMTENGTGEEVEDYLTTNVPGMNMIGLIVASLTCGRAISHVGDPALPLLNLAEAVFLVSLRIVGLFLWFAPIGVFSLVAANLASLEAPGEAFRSLSLFLVTFFSGAIIHSLIVLPIIHYIISRRNPYRFLFRLSQALLTAFVTDSSAATIPILIRCLENNKVDPRVSRQVASLGATINKNGGTLFFPIIAIFVAQTNGIVLNIGQIITINLVTISMVAGHAPTSGGGIVYIILLLTAVGLPTDGFALILAIDWLLERCRTTINVLGNGFVAGMIDHLSMRDLESEGPVNINRISIDIDSPLSLKETVAQNGAYKRRTSI